MTDDATVSGSETDLDTDEAIGRVVLHMARIGVGAESVVRVALGRPGAIAAAIDALAASHVEAERWPRHLVLRRLEDALDLAASAVARGVA